MLIFAQPSDVETFTGQPAPDNAVPLIRRASQMVQTEVRRARFDVTPAGTPSDPDVSDALRDAVCAQVSYWATSDVDPTRVDTTAPVSSTSIDGASMSYDTATAKATTLGVSDNLCGEATDILWNAGLVGVQPWA